MPRDRTLPIFDLEVELAAAAASENARVVIEAPTGSGKSTQVPQFLADSGVCREEEIYVLQPRRLAARMLAKRVSEERETSLGQEVGYQVRFENVVSSSTRIRFVTEGILIRKLIGDPELKGVGAVVLDEFHERNFFGDISLARCLEVQRECRPDLKLVVMSATLEAAPLTEYLGEGCHLLRSEGRTFPVEIQYHPSRQRHRDHLWDLASRALKDHIKQHGLEGHALIFMPGKYEIQKTSQTLRKASWTSHFDIHELYGELPPAKQDEAVSSSSRPKIVIATNVAETSVTIEGVTLVIDSGLERRSAFDHRRAITTLHIETISKASADQRAGRAGRTAPGHAIRLWSERDQEQRSSNTPAEIHRMDLTEAILVLAAGGVASLRSFPWFEPPDSRGIDEAVSRLQILGALDASEQLTPVGKKISQFPVSPRYGRILLAGAEAGCLEFAALISAISQSRPIFPKQKREAAHLMPEDFSSADDVSDFQPLIRAWRQMKENGFNRDVGHRLGIHVGACRDVERVASQLIRIANRWNEASTIAGLTGETLAKILLTGFSDRLALRNNTSTLACSVIGGRKGQLDKNSVANQKSVRLFLANEMVEVEGKEISVNLSLCTQVEDKWLSDMFPEAFSNSDGAVWDGTHRRVEARKERRFRDLVLESKDSGQVPEEMAAEILAEKVQSGELNLKSWDEKAFSWIARVNLISRQFPEYEVPEIDEESKRLIVEQVCSGATSYKQIKDRSVWPALKEWLPASQASLLDLLAPERIQLSNGREAKVFYGDEGKPKISVLIQHLFGLKDTPSLCEGRVPLLVEILAPNHRPVQVTEDLAGFWTGSYPAVRSQLRGRYPKHDWPEY